MEYMQYETNTGKKIPIYFKFTVIILSDFSSFLHEWKTREQYLAVFSATCTILVFAL